ncbi:thymidine phosphorylase [Anaerotignum sp.]|uniref:thymidine phosphorylase n=1 Tax=Anaerotignum sp. TaxID=2039241 RepID=UPI002A90DD9C|nr:thymidine phosphorylase [Anaerotignum sp.]MCI7657270.1 thymidine phosphorylase [Clostridia bacterium]MDY5415493.1 thymidine phosphorylase [Anaerotignum sp.]
MDFQDIIIKKRDKQKLTKEEISFFIHGVTDGSLPDYQISALLMAILLNGMDAEETAQMTMEMAHSGTLFDLSSLPGFKVDKHSTGGVGDTTTLILAPLVASLGVPVVKMSGRGLGFSGGTIDKLESIPGFQVGVTEENALTYGKTSHLVLMSQTDNLTPADKKLYALRDVTGTVDSIPLIAASIMSKKIAAGADGIVLDVKCGSGAFMKTQKDAEALAHIMVEMGHHVGRKVTAIISGMDQPLGMYIGNSLEVMEAMEVLKGNVKGDLLEVSLLLGAHMLLLAGRVQTEAEGKALLQQQIDNGAGIAKFRELLIQQGGNPAIIEQPDLLPLSPCSLEVKAEKSGYLTHMDTAKIGRASQETGAGRAFKEQPLDFGAGIITKKRLGDYVETGEVLAVIYSATDKVCASAAEIFQSALTISSEKAPLPPLVLNIISA